MLMIPDREIVSYEEYLESTKPIEPIKVPTKSEIHRKKWKSYWNKVWEITNQQNLKSLKNIEKRGFNNYHIDHQISIWYGYNNNVSPESIGNISNLKMIPYKENMKKGNRINGQTILI